MVKDLQEYAGRPKPVVLPYGHETSTLQTGGFDVLLSEIGRRRDFRNQQVFESRGLGQNCRCRKNGRNRDGATRKPRRIVRMQAITELRRIHIRKTRMLSGKTQ
ncbi:MAG: hypothetical protein PHR28_08760 [candidate division Zixibacteria bacterium]|nr:hypothetical protein [candidate division Zixibacteria bacterium]